MPTLDGAKRTVETVLTNQLYMLSTDFLTIKITITISLISSSSKFYFQQNTTMEQYQEKENTL